jgi:hypothetical protein
MATMAGTADHVILALAQTSNALSSLPILISESLHFARLPVIAFECVRSRLPRRDRIETEDVV